ncbi:hypothetical protein GCM10009000_076160 [Halobacterium noricense]|uniref:Pyrrolo-quinoline quinone repeat domain-containing protein n=1 Tax=Haladaptatus pallidirubidus TaxID=1008152 RepID=A0AAV3UME0_9EURY
MVKDGRIYHGYSREATNEERGGAWLEAFDAKTGKSQWKIELWHTDEFHYFYVSDSLVLRGNRIFVQTKPGLKAVGIDGTPRWTFDNLYRGQQTPDIVSPIVTDDTIVTGTYNTSVEETGEPETVFGIDPDDGSERWQTEFPELSGMWQQSAADGIVYVPFSGDCLVALDITNGQELWRRYIPVHGTPSIADGQLFVGLTNDKREENDIAVAAFDRESGRQQWRKSAGYRWPDSGLAVANGLVYHVGKFDLQARRVDTGERVWEFGGQKSEKRRIELKTTPVVAGDSVYVNGSKQKETTFGQLFVVDANTGEKRGQFSMGRNRYTMSVPAVTEELVFVSTNDGRLSAIAECNTKLFGHCLIG